MKTGDSNIARIIGWVGILVAGISLFIPFAKANFGVSFTLIGFIQDNPELWVFIWIFGALALSALGVGRASKILSILGGLALCSFFIIVSMGIQESMKSNSWSGMDYEPGFYGMIIGAVLVIVCGFMLPKKEK